MDTTKSASGSIPFNERNFIVPADLVMDVLQVVFNYRVSYQIGSVNAEEGHLTLNVNSRGQSPHYRKAVENIEVLLNEYKEFEKLCDIR